MTIYNKARYLEMSKIIQILGKLQKSNFSPIFICADGETKLSKYHAEYLIKYIEPYIDRILDPNDEMTILNLIHFDFLKFSSLFSFTNFRYTSCFKAHLINGNIIFL